MTFEEYLYALPNDKRLDIFQLFQNYGEPNAVLSELSAMTPCVQNKGVDVRINQKYFFWHRNKAFMVEPHTSLFTWRFIQYCYHCSGEGGIIGIVGVNGAHKEFYAQDDPGSALIFDKIRTYVKGFENTTPYDCKEDLAEVKVRAGIYINASYILKNDTIIQARVTLLRNVKEKILVPNTHDILWCRQRFESDSEGGDSHILELFLLGQRDPCRLYFVSAHAAFQFVLELKKRVPHLLYGHNEEYEEIFKQNPAHLLAIGKSIMNP